MTRELAALQFRVSKCGWRTEIALCCPLWPVCARSSARTGLEVMPQYDEGFLALPERGWRRYKVPRDSCARLLTPTLLAVATLRDEPESFEGRVSIGCHLAGPLLV